METKEQNRSLIRLIIGFVIVCVLATILLIQRLNKNSVEGIKQVYNQGGITLHV